MVAEINNGTVFYMGKEYKFKLADEQYHRHTSLIVGPQHIRIIKNNTELSTKDLKAQIVQTWFGAENDRVRSRSNAKRRAKRATNG
jgi:hypothetical protein|tara:strand:+ start:574 stop:831 length:258 start_codon:yes stop_codon:yes gene_type:complete